MQTAMRLNVYITKLCALELQNPRCTELSYCHDVDDYEFDLEIDANK